MGFYDAQGGLAGTTEERLVTADEVRSSDFVRIVQDSSSRKITLENFTSSQRDLLLALGFITSAQITQARTVLTVTAGSYALKTTDEILSVDTSAGDVTISLFDSALVYDAGTRGTRLYQIKKTDDSDNRVFIRATGIDTIDGDEQVVLFGGLRPFINIYPDSANRWFTI